VECGVFSINSKPFLSLECKNPISSAWASPENYLIILIMHTSWPSLYVTSRIASARAEMAI